MLVVCWYCLFFVNSSIGYLDGQESDLWVLGNIFLRKYYSVFNLTSKEISLAEAV